ncbi:hypothetical protein GEU84_000050 [Fertoebacter nigrum]|uniref:GspL cytoplasmic actin-ATPase-like domain-containing protein n=1 Tax=Fertoeibacter niger TaxID=2656921 RepID=A0A8X8GTG3_9RHOB|nr:type II secretion system protein GspL [Fertoeibacter niger]NUB42762.1 hypothetical protein [Fertoeibacter niger]
MAETPSIAAVQRPALHLVVAGPATPASPDDGAVEGRHPGPPLPAAPPAPPGVVWLPGEDVLLLAVELPAMPAAQRRAAIGFAVEDRIAQPLDEVDVILGPALGPSTWLAAVVARNRRPQAGGARLLPDTLALPVPAAGWAVWAGARVLVRPADGSGFACRPTDLALFWAAAGAPPITLYAGDLPPGMAVTARAALPAAIAPALAGFDLAQHRHGAGQGLPRGLGALAAVLTLAVAGHLALMAADVLALSRLSASREAELRVALTAAGQPPGADLDTSLARALAARQPAGQGGFLPLMAQVFAAMAPEAGHVTLRDLRYDAAEGSAQATLDAPDLATLQGLETALAAAGLAVTAGAATTGDGGAEVQMTLRALP